MSRDSKYYQYNPEKRNIFIEIHSGRTNFIREIFIGLVLFFSSYAASIVEVFLRRKFGERYITFAQTITIFIFVPWIIGSSANFFYQILYAFSGGYQSRPDLGVQMALLYLFIFGYLAMAIIHRLEIRRYGTAYDFKRFSLSDGEIHPLWYRLIGKEVLGFKITFYTVVTFLEPLVPIIIGFFLMLIPPFRLLGILLFICGFLFGVRNFHKAQLDAIGCSIILIKKSYLKCSTISLWSANHRRKPKGFIYPLNCPMMMKYAKRFIRPFPMRILLKMIFGRTMAWMKSKV